MKTRLAGALRFQALGKHSSPIQMGSSRDITSAIQKCPLGWLKRQLSFVVCTYQVAGTVLSILHTSLHFSSEEPCEVCVPAPIPRGIEVQWGLGAFWATALTDK